MYTDSVPQRHNDQNVPRLPRPYRCVKQIALASVLLVLVTIGLRIWWGWEADRRLNALIAKYQAAGEPVYPQDFDPEAIADEDNAALLYWAAARAVKVPSNPPVKIADLSYSLKACREHKAFVKSLVDDNSDVLDLLRESRALPESDWGLRFESPMNLSESKFDFFRTPIRIAAIAANNAQLEGRHTEAIEYLHDMLAMGKHTESMLNPTLSHLIAIAIESIPASSIESLNAGLFAEQESPLLPEYREQVELLITELLDDESQYRSWLQSMFAERAMRLDVSNIARRGELNWSSIKKGKFERISPSTSMRIASLLLGPMVALDSVKLMQEMSLVANAGDQQHFHAGKDMLPIEPPPGDFSLKGLTRFWGGIISGKFEVALKLHYRVLAQRRLAAAALAIRLFEADNGRLPETLEQLVPDYLPEVPRDPFSWDGEPIRYIDDPESPRVYSLNLDGLDQQGKRWTEPDGTVERDMGDWVLYLNDDGPRN